ncbi:MAG: hypothetical protein GX606_04855, partial [Elusimicrobia bacterium]|nr:hypothetical protein [Elusimicrobiota bacterium]
MRFITIWAGGFLLSTSLVFAETAPVAIQQRAVDLQRRQEEAPDLGRAARVFRFEKIRWGEGIDGADQERLGVVLEGLEGRFLTEEELLIAITAVKDSLSVNG